MVPVCLLRLFSPSEAERLFCGRATIDVALLKKHTEYSGVSADAPHIRYFWQVLEEFGQEERRRFVKFAYAQERLPATSEEFEQYPRTRMLIKAASLPSSSPSRSRSSPTRSQAITAAGRSGSGSGSGSASDANASSDNPEGSGDMEPLSEEQRRIDQMLPRADTCFFNVLLPAYSSLAVMRQRLTTIVSMDSWGMDGDDVELDDSGRARAQTSE